VRRRVLRGVGGVSTVLRAAARMRGVGGVFRAGAARFGGSGVRGFSSGTSDVPKMLSGPQRAMIDREMQQQREMKANREDESWSAQQRTMVDRIFQSDVARTENEIRHDLKVAHRLIAKYGMDDLVWNHISARCLDDQTADCCELPSTSYLITPGGMHFSEVRSEDLVFDTLEESGNVIHSGIYQKRPDVRCIIHIHTPAIMAVSVLKEGFKFLTQDSAPFYNRLGYHAYEGLHTADEEKCRIADSLGKDGIAIIMPNHGATVVGRSIQETWVRTYYLDRCCQVQIAAMSTGSEILECSEDLLVHAQEQIERYFPHGKYEVS